MRMSRLVFALFAVLSLALAQSGNPPASTNQEKMIDGLTEQFRLSLKNMDAAAYDKLVADDFITIGTSGRLFTKAQIIENLKSAKLTYEQHDYSNRKIRLFGDTAIVNCTLDQRARLGDRELVGQYLLVMVWVKRNGLWQLVSWQATPVAKT